MDAIDRRTALWTLVGGVVAAGVGASLIPDVAEAMPLALQKVPGKDAGDFKQEAQADIDSRRPGGPPGRPPGRPPHRPPHHHHRRRRRRWVCWRERGRRRCGWRWV